jgi:allantoinase
VRVVDLIIRSTRVVFPDSVKPACLHVRDGRIVRIGTHAERSEGVPEIDAGTFVVLPGLVDTHVHVNEPGRTGWEGFQSATRAAAAGGVTTLVDMPLNSIPPTTSLERLEVKREAARGQCHVDVGFWGGVVPGNARDLRNLAAEGVRGFKCFLSPSGVDEFPCVTEPDLREALPVIAALGLPLLVHAELPSVLRAPGRESDPRAYSTWLLTRPADAEEAAIALLVRLARETGARVHIVHLASSDALPAIRAARADGVPVTVETCPHYLTFAADAIPDGATVFKCAPPVRERRHQEGLWDGLLAGEIDLVATDHSPAPPAEKHLEDGDFLRAWGGIASLQLGLAAIWTGAAGRGIGFDRIAEWMAAAPARLAGLPHLKGSIAVGREADLVIWDPDGETLVTATSLQHRHPVTPYDGMRLRGRVHRTLLRGEVIFDDGTFAGAPRGRLLP